MGERGPATPFPAGPRGRGRCFLPRSQRRAGGRLQTGHDVTAGGGAGGPSIPAEEPRPRSPIPSLLPGSRRDFLFLCGAPGFARRWLPAGDKTRSLGEGRRRQSRGGGRGLAGSGPAPHPSGSRAPRPAPPSPAGAAAALPGPGLASRPAPGPGRSRPGPHPRGPTAPRRARPARTYPGRRSRRSARSPAAAAARARPSAAPRPWPRRRVGSARPAALGPHAGRPPPPPLRHPGQLSPRAGSAFLPPARPRRRRRRSPRRRGRRACAGAGPGAHGALWPARPAGGPQRRGRKGGRTASSRAGPDAPARAPRTRPGALRGGLRAAAHPIPVQRAHLPGQGASSHGGGGAIPGYSPLQRLDTYCAPGRWAGPSGQAGDVCWKGACAALRTTSPSSAERPAADKPQCGGRSGHRRAPLCTPRGQAGQGVGGEGCSG